MAPLTSEYCVRCWKHPLKIKHLDRVSCDGCIPGDGTLRRCNACKVFRYCSRDCQRADWKTHKPVCAAYAEMREMAERAGLAARRKALEDWCDINLQVVAQAGLSALGFHEEKGRLETHSLLVFLDVVEEPSATTPEKPKFTQYIRDALCVPLQSIRQKFDITVEEMPGRPGLFRILVIDDRLPDPLDFVSLEVTIGDGSSDYDQNWLEYMKRYSLSSSG